jgi:hypothetical protein
VMGSSRVLYSSMVSQPPLDLQQPGGSTM